MNNIIDRLYDLHLNTDSFPLGVPNKENSDKEWEIYNFLYENLPQVYKKYFLQYVELQGIRKCEGLRAVYEHGFKTAIQLITDCLKE